MRAIGANETKVWTFFESGGIKPYIFVKNFIVSDMQSANIACNIFFGGMFYVDCKGDFGILWLGCRAFCADKAHRKQAIVTIKFV